MPWQLNIQNQQLIFVNNDPHRAGQIRSMVISANNVDRTTNIESRFNIQFQYNPEDQTGLTAPRTSSIRRFVRSLFRAAGGRTQEPVTIPNMTRRFENGQYSLQEIIELFNAEGISRDLLANILLQSRPVTHAYGPIYNAPHALEPYHDDARLDRLIHEYQTHSRIFASTTGPTMQPRRTHFTPFRDTHTTSTLLSNIRAAAWNKTNVASSTSEIGSHFKYTPVIPNMIDSVEIQSHLDAGDTKFSISINFKQITKEQYQEFAKLCMKLGSQLFSLPPYETGKTSFTIENADWFQLYALGIVLQDRNFGLNLVADQSLAVAEGIRVYNRINIASVTSMQEIKDKINSEVRRKYPDSASVDVAGVVMSLMNKIVGDYSESSMAVLRPDQLELVFALNKKYAGKVNTSDKQQVIINEILGFCEQEYNKQPAKFTFHSVGGNGEILTRIIDLPLKFSEFQQLIKDLGLNEQEIKKANECYYEHPIHSAYRFLKEYDEWISPFADFVKFQKEVDGVALYSANISEDDIRLICMSWLAINDPAYSERADFMRTMFFGVGLQDCLRGHNRDFNADDNAGDSPSCGIGTTQRLINGMMSTKHPEFTFPSADELLSPSGILGDIIRELYINKFSRDGVNVEHAYKLLDESNDDWYLVTPPDKDGLELLGNLNLTHEDIKEISKKIEDYLRTQPLVSDKPTVIATILQAVNQKLHAMFVVKEHCETIDDLHMNKLYVQYGLNKILAGMQPHIDKLHSV